MAPVKMEITRRDALRLMKLIKSLSYKRIERCKLQGFAFTLENFIDSEENPAEIPERFGNVVRCMFVGRIIGAIKELRAQEKIGLRDAKNIIDYVRAFCSYPFAGSPSIEFMMSYRKSFNEEYPSRDAPPECYMHIAKKIRQELETLILRQSDPDIPPEEVILVDPKLPAMRMLPKPVLPMNQQQCPIPKKKTSQVVHEFQERMEFIKEMCKQDTKTMGGN